MKDIKFKSGQGSWAAVEFKAQSMCFVLHTITSVWGLGQHELHKWGSLDTHSLQVCIDVQRPHHKNFVTPLSLSHCSPPRHTPRYAWYRAFTFGDMKEKKKRKRKYFLIVRKGKSSNKEQWYFHYNSILELFSIWTCKADRNTKYWSCCCSPSGSIARESKLARTRSSCWGCCWSLAGSKGNQVHHALYTHTTHTYIPHTHKSLWWFWTVIIFFLVRK